MQTNAKNVLRKKYVINFNDLPQINLPQVKAIDNEYYKTIEAKKYALTIIPASNIAFRRAKREFYFQLIYHNNAIEGRDARP